MKITGKSKVLCLLLSLLVLFGSVPSYASEVSVRAVKAGRSEEAYSAAEVCGQDAAEEEAVVVEVQESTSYDRPQSSGEEAAAASEEAVVEEEAPAEEPETLTGAQEAAVREESASEEELPFGLSGMPEDYVLSEEQTEIKEEMAEHHVLSDLEDMEPGVDYEENEVVILAEDRKEAELIAEAYNGRLASFRYGVAVIELAENEVSVEEAVSAGMDTDNNLPAVEPNYIVTIEEEAVVEEEADNEQTNASIASVSNAVSSGKARQDYDSFYASLTDPDPFLDVSNPKCIADNEKFPCYQWWHDMIHSYTAWGMNTDCSSVTVAVLDTGVNLNHKELPDVTMQDPNGYAPEGGDEHGHGSHVAGIIAASLNNGLIGAGVAPGAKILSIPVVDSDGAGTIDKQLVAFNYMLSTGKPPAKIVNMSLGTLGYSASMQKAINSLYHKDVVIVAAMGNEAANCRSYPAAYDHVIAVSAVDQSGRKANFSNFGPWADIAAPGYKMVSSYKGGSTTYTSMNGTSMSTPVIAGACALYMSVYGEVSPAAMENVLKKSVTKSSSPQIGSGIIDLEKMFSAVPDVPSVSPSNGSDFNLSSSAAITLKRASSSKGDGSILYTLDGKNPAVSNGMITAGEIYSTPITASDLISRGFYSGRTLTLKAAEISGVGKLGKITTVKYTLTGSVTAAQAASAAAGASAASYTGAVKSLTLDKKRADIGVGPTANESNSRVTITVTEVKDANGNSVKPAECSYSWTSSDPGIAKVTASGNSATVSSVKKGSVKITCTVNGSRSAVCSVNVKQLTEKLTITGQKYVANGASAAYKAAVLPANAGNKKVLWSLQEKVSGVTVNESNGRVTVNGARANTPFTLVATAEDGGSTASFNGIVTGSKASSVRLSIASASSEYSAAVVSPAYNNAGSLSSIRLFNADHRSLATADNRLTVKGEVSNGSEPVWSSNNPKVATVTVDPGDPTRAVVKANSAGTAKIVCKAQDGSNKSASLTVRVTVPVSRVYVTANNAQDTIASGCSATLKAVAGTSYGKPTTPKVTWAIKEAKNDSGMDRSAYVTLSSSGKVTVNQQFTKGKIVVSATSTDGTGLSGVYYLNVIPKCTTLKLAGTATSVVVHKPDSEKIYSINIDSDSLCDDVIVTSSNPSLMSGYYSITTDSAGNITNRSIRLACPSCNTKGTGKVTFKVKINDGSNKTYSFNARYD